MAAPQQPPPAKKPPQTTITALDQDTLREIFLRLPSLPSLVRAVLSCRAFLDAVRSSPAFRRQFRALHPPPLLGLFLGIPGAATPTFVPLLRRSDPDIAAAVRGADFFLTQLPLPEDDDKEDAVSVPVPEVHVAEQDEDTVSVPVSEDDDEDAVFEWSIQDCRDGFVVLDNWSTQQIAVYNPLTRTMDLFPRPPGWYDDPDGLYLDFHILVSEQDRRWSFRVVCVWHGDHGARAVVLSSDIGKWQIFPLTDMDGRWPHHGNLVNGCIYWPVGMPDARVLNTTTMQFFRMDMPLDRGVNEMLTDGETKDGRLCVVSAPTVSLTFESALVVWIWRADDEGVERWVLDKSFLLQEILGIVRCEFRDVVTNFQLRVKAIIDGVVYLSTYCGTWEHHHSNLWLLSFCMETAVLNNLSRIIHDACYPYIMSWPRSLVGTQQGEHSRLTKGCLTRRIFFSSFIFKLWNFCCLAMVIRFTRLKNKSTW